MQDSRAELAAIAAEALQIALDRNALTYGDYTLSSGLRSGYYFDGRRLTLDARGCYLAGRAVYLMSLEFGVDAIGGPTLGSDPIVAAAALASHLAGEPISAFIVRKASKLHGAGQLIEGPLATGSRVAIVDDTCSTGGSLFHAVEAAERFGCKVAAVMAILDRRQGGSEEAQRRGYPFRALLEATDDGRIGVSRWLAAAG